MSTFPRPDHQLSPSERAKVTRPEPYNWLERKKSRSLNGWKCGKTIPETLNQRLHLSPGWEPDPQV
ncbi:MAG: hypothetical protein ACFFDN_40005, partial [Candidatus Hodarchaeota archaeon]